MGTVVTRSASSSGASGSDLLVAVAGGRAAPALPAASAPVALETLEREHILEVLRQVNGNRMAAAKVLGISRRALHPSRHRAAPARRRRAPRSAHWRP
jgi:ActR/RegA family two-component response regulator